MARITTKTQSFNNVAAGSTAILTFPVGGLSYHQTMVKFTNLTLAQMKNIKLKVNGHTIQEWKDGERLNSENKHYKRGSATANLLPIFFIRKELETLYERRMFALGTADISTLTLHIDIDEAAVNPKLEGWHTQGNPAPLGIITRKLTLPWATSTGGIKEISDIPKDTAGAAIAAIHVYCSDVKAVELIRNNEVIFDLPNEVVAKMQVDHDRDPQSATKVTIDFLLEGDTAQALQLDSIRDLRLKLHSDVETSGDLVVEYIENAAETVLS